MWVKNAGVGSRTKALVEARMQIAGRSDCGAKRMLSCLMMALQGEYLMRLEQIFLVWSGLEDFRSFEASLQMQTVSRRARASTRKAKSDEYACKEVIAMG